MYSAECRESRFLFGSTGKNFYRDLINMAITENL
nr:MAG TPA: hypothetical protein [Caudoviricetes sp.]